MVAPPRVPRNASRAHSEGRAAGWGHPARPRTVAASRWPGSLSLQDVLDISFGILLFIFLPTLIVYISFALLGNAWRRKAPDTTPTKEEEVMLAIAGIVSSFATTAIGIVVGLLLRG